MKKLLFLCFLLFPSILLFSQTPKFQWVKGGGSAASGDNNQARESAQWLVTDARGNIYGMSSLFGTDCQIDTFHTQGYLYDDFGVFSYRCDGSLRWVRYYGSTSNDYTGGYNVDPQGNSYVSGYVSVYYDWLRDGHFGDTTVIATPNMNCGNFISRLDSNGKTVWLKLLGNTQNDLVLRIIQQEFDNQGNPCILIDFFQTGNWGNFTIPQKGFYVVRVNKNNGNIIDVTKLDFNIVGRTVFLALDESNNFYINLQIYDTLFLGPNIILDTYSTDHYQSYILAKFSPSGNLIWYKELGGKPGIGYLTEKRMFGKPIIKNNKIYINGAANNHVSVFGDTINNPYLTVYYQRIPMNMCFDKNTGNFIKLKHLYNTNYCDDYFATIVTDKIYMATSAGRVVWLNNTDTIPYINNNKAYPFIIAMDTNYNQIDWGIATKVNADYTRIRALTVDLAGNIYAGGEVSDSIYNSFGSGYQSIGGATDFFITKIAYTNNCACVMAQPNPILVSFNGSVITVKGNATGTLDSLYWVWGDGSKTKYINQNTNVTHTYSMLGNYTVNLRTYNNCGIKDGGFPINVVGINEQELNYFNAYPNPVTNILTIDNPYQCQMQIKLYNITGKLLFSSNYTDNTANIDMKQYDKGIYLAEIILADGRKTVKKIVIN